MATACINEVEDFVTCGVCLCEYDEEIRKPKFLPCSHTVCFLCLQGIRRGDTITCPFCRKTISKDSRKEVEWILPNNTYALQMLKLNKQVPLSAASSTVMQNKTTAELLKFKDDLVKMRDAGFNKLALAIEKRKEVQEQVGLVMKCLKVAEEEVTKFQDENNLCLVEMISILEANATSGSSSTKPEKDLILSDLMSMVEGATSGDTIETLKQKITKTVAIYEQKLKEATEIAENTNSKTKIRVHLTDENGIPIPTCSELRFQPMAQGSNGPQVLQDSILLSHTTVASLKRKTNLKTEQPTAASASAATTLPPSVPSNSRFFLGNLPSKFILRFYEYYDQVTVENRRGNNPGIPKGEIHIRPAPTFHPEFVKQLGDFCYKSPQKLIGPIEKAMPGVFVQFSMATWKFKPAVPSLIGHYHGENRSYDQLYDFEANDINDVGIDLVRMIDGQVMSYDLIIILEEHEKFKKRKKLHETVSNSELFGRVIHQHMDCANRMSRVATNQRGHYFITLESQ